MYGCACIYAFGSDWEVRRSVGTSSFQFQMNYYREIISALDREDREEVVLLHAAGLCRAIAISINEIRLRSLFGRLLC
jgi:hypothetical protein